ncbi:hypothetical protein JCM10207_006199 [Rhodosporidiobolus poonsookiae]
METALGAFSEASPPPSATSAPSSSSPTQPAPPPDYRVPCQSYNCAAVFVPLLLASLVAAVLVGCTLITATHTLRTVKRRHGPASVRAGLLVVVFVQVAQWSLELARVCSVFAANFGDLSFFAQPRFADLLASLLGVILQSTAQLLLLQRAYLYLKEQGDWSAWARKAVAGTVGVAWLAALVAGLAFCWQGKHLVGSTILAPGQPGGQWLDRFALAWLILVVCIGSLLSAILIFERWTKPSKASADKPIVVRILELHRACFSTGLALVSVQVALLLGWIFHTCYGHDSQLAGWLQGLIALLPPLSSCTSVALLASPPPRPRPRRTPKRRKTDSASFATESEYYDRPVLIFSDTYVPTTTLPSALRPPAPPYSSQSQRHSAIRSRSPLAQSQSRSAGSPYVVEAPERSPGAVETPFHVALASQELFQRNALESAAEKSAPPVPGEQTLVDRSLDEETVVSRSFRRPEQRFGCEDGGGGGVEKGDVLDDVFEQLRALEEGRVEEVELDGEKRQRRKGMVGGGHTKLSSPDTQDSPRPSPNAHIVPFQRCSTASLEQYDPSYPLDCPSPAGSSCELASFELASLELPSFELVDAPAVDDERERAARFPFPPAGGPVSAPPPAPVPRGTAVPLPPALPPTLTRLARPAGARHARWGSAVSRVTMRTHASESSFGCRDGMR